MLVLPVQPNTPFSRFRCTLDQQTFQFELSWNMRAGWFLSLKDVDGNVVFASTRLVADWDMLQFCTAATRPRGALVCMDNTGRHENPGYADLGGRHELLYFSPDEQAEIAAEIAADA